MFMHFYCDIFYKTSSPLLFCHISMIAMQNC